MSHFINPFPYLVIGSTILITPYYDYVEPTTSEKAPVGTSYFQEPQLPSSSYNTITFLSSTSDSKEKKILSNFVNSLMEGNKGLDGEISELINKNFWDLV